MSTIKDSVTFIFIVCMTLAMGALSAYVYIHEVLMPSMTTGTQEAVTDSSLKIPPSLKVQMGEPVEVRAETRGKKVVWMALEPELTLRPIDNKSIWVSGKKVGTYRLVAWTAINGLPTTNALCIVQVEQAPDTEVKDEKK